MIKPTEPDVIPDQAGAQKAPSVDRRQEIFGLRGLFDTQLSLHLTEEQRAQRFRMGELYAVVSGFCIVSIAGITYAVLSWGQPHRYLIVAILTTAIIFAVGCYICRYRIVALSWRLWFFAAWNSSAFVAVSCLCALDGGVRSVMSFALLLPMIYLASGYPLRAARVCCGVGLVSYSTLVACTSAPLPWATVLLQATCMLVGCLLALSGAANRQRQDNEAQYLRERLEKLASTDDLTGCLNKRAFTRALDREIERATRYRHSLALLTIDIDHFKQINDRHGHLMGDEVLRQIGFGLRQTARASDIVGRPGGDELALLAPEAGCAEAHRLAKRVHHAANTIKAPVEITLSIGISVSSPNAEPAAAIFRCADQALYAAKRRGRNQSVVFGEQPTESSPTALVAGCGS